MTDEQRLEVFKCVFRYFYDLKALESEGEEGGLAIAPYIEPVIDQVLEEARKRGFEQGKAAQD